MLLQNIYLLWMAVNSKCQFCLFNIFPRQIQYNIKIEKWANLFIIGKYDFLLGNF